MNKNQVAVVGIVCATAVTTVNLCFNDDGVSVTALFTMIGTVLGYLFGVANSAKGQDETHED